MYLGIDFLIGSGLRPFVVDVNIGLPGGAQEYDRTFLVRAGVRSGIFEDIEAISRACYGKPFRGYLDSLPFLPALKAFKLWADGEGLLPAVIPPVLRLEDKWVQYRVLKGRVPMPATVLFDAAHQAAARSLLERCGSLVVKRRTGRGGRGFGIVREPRELRRRPDPAWPMILQEHVDSRVDGHVFSLRALAFAGRFLCAYASLARSAPSNHGVLAYVEPGNRFGLTDRAFETVSFHERSWEAGLGFGDTTPACLGHSLYEDTVGRTSLVLPESLWTEIRAAALEIEHIYDTLAPASLPRAFFG